MAYTKDRIRLAQTHARGRGEFEAIAEGVMEPSKATCKNCGYSFAPAVALYGEGWTWCAQWRGKKLLAAPACEMWRAQNGVSLPKDMEPSWWGRWES